jgi:hypothetical protein
MDINSKNQKNDKILSNLSYEINKKKYGIVLNNTMKNTLTQKSNNELPYFL